MSGMSGVRWDEMWDEQNEWTVNEEGVMEIVFFYDKTLICIRQEFV